MLTTIFGIIVILLLAALIINIAVIIRHSAAGNRPRVPLQMMDKKELKESK